MFSFTVAGLAMGQSLFQGAHQISKHMIQKQGKPENKGRGVTEIKQINATW
jgi:hypothetical protein